MVVVVDVAVDVDVVLVEVVDVLVVAVITASCSAGRLAFSPSVSFSQQVQLVYDPIDSSVVFHVYQDWFVVFPVAV